MKIQNASQIGRIIKLHRKKSRLTQLELAKMAGIGKTAVFDAEKGNDAIKLHTLLAIFTVLNISVELMGPVMEQVGDLNAKG